ncbi:phosphoglycerate mutase-like protein [Durotheca rogersii]|uniref:phosphoglycerate mutase-like protein n=1 Tax=Durotheca rogersii TaxID=419775 RepID=UPI0022209385|nr:phosphoglycerate mutase-like protein [Durotheca rogersii]KAI5860831.1 phosphoglycerate mutase-like protein [Durotheca rogersii]
MPPTLILVRHAQAQHNATKDFKIPDPGLTEEGREQCADLRKSLVENPLAQQAELIVVSPLRRVVQTALRSVDWLIEKGVKIEAHAGWQENSVKPCDTGSPVDRLVQEFPSVDFSKVDPVFPDKTSPAASHYHFTKEALLARAQESLKQLYERPEKVIVVVSHSAFLRLAVSGYWYFNADYRIFDFEPVHGPRGPYRLEQHESTREKGGGLGRSWIDPVVLGSELPVEDPEAEGNGKNRGY